MDTVACYGSETKLIECSYHTDTSEDAHSEDVWVKCGSKDSSKESFRGSVNQSNANSAAALTVALVVCLLVIVSGAVYAVVKYVRNRKLSNVNER